MVNFAAKLASNIVVEWTEYYVDYTQLKKLIDKVQRNALLQRKASSRRNSNASIASIVPKQDPQGKRKDLLTEIERAYAESIHSEKTDDFKLDVSAPILTNGNVHSGYGSISLSPLDAPAFDPRDDPDKEYQLKIRSEIIKVETFYESTFKKLKDSLNVIQTSIDNVEKKSLDFDADVEEDYARLSKLELSTESMKRSCINLYRKSTYLKNYAVLNYTAFVKISKKHDKVTKLKSGKANMDVVNRQDFSKGLEVQELMDKLETYFADNFCGGDHTVARSELLMKHRPMGDWQMMHLGMRIGIVLVLLLWTIWDAAIDSTHAPIPTEIFQIFRGFSCFVLAYWCWALTIYVWNSAHINYLYLFELDPRHTLHPIEIIFKASTVTLVYLICVLLYTKLAHEEIYGVSPQYAIYVPFVLFLFMVSNLFFPWQQQKTIIYALYDLFSAPFSDVTFFCAFVGDLLTSLVKPLVDLAFTMCFFFSGEWQLSPIDPKHASNKLFKTTSTCETNGTFRLIIPFVISLPLWFRFAQNLRRYYDTHSRVPHLINSGKYALAFSLVLFGALHPEFDVSKEDLKEGEQTEIHVYKFFFVLALLLSTLFTFIWDVKMDWGLGEVRHGFLRSELMYPRKWVYQVSIGADLFLRFIWCLTLVPELRFIFGEYSYVITPVLAWLELSRRTMWCWIRVEHEHLHNTQGYRRVDIIPLHFQRQRDEIPLRKANKKATIFELLAFIGLVLTLATLSFVTRTAE